MGDRLERAVQAFPDEMPYATASVTLKYHVYSLGFGDVLGVYLGHHGRVLSPRNGVKQLPVWGVCDSDIQGEENQKIFQRIFEQMRDFSQTRQATGIEPIPEVCVKTEQEEPLLMLPDHIAGYVRSKKVYGKGAENERASLIEDIDQVVSRWPSGLLSIGSQDFIYGFPIDVTQFEAAATFAKTKEGRKIIARTWGAKT